MNQGISARFRVDRGSFALDLDLSLPGRGITALFGHSGSGKTTCLRVLAGLERPPGGYCAVSDEVWQDESRRHFVPPHRRAIGVVFQESSLFAHLDVQDNIEFGAKRVPAAARRFHLGEVCELLGIGHLLKRSPLSLSGGERQRAAIARALLAAPRLLLLDEPLAALDQQRKEEILPYLERLHRELALPMIYVSHSRDEVARLADHLVLLDSGRCVASGPLKSVLGRLDLPTALSDDAAVVIDATVAEHASDGLTRLRFAGGEIHVSQRHEALGTALRCRIHARDVSLALVPQSQSSILNCVAASVCELAATDTPGHVMVRLDAGGEVLLARITRRSAEALAIRPGLAVHAQIKAVALLA